ncbi:hypothetical protein DOT_3494 [Desulfosporosinus sp. OT]|nr:hypothetical protein DOT_3494 [Desulfosporosinus sp. OT]
MCGTALGAYDAEQTNRSSSCLGSGVHPTPESIPFRIAASAKLSTGDYRAKSAILGALAAVHILVHCPVCGVAFTEFANSAYVETSGSCHTASCAWIEETFSPAL